MVHRRHPSSRQKAVIAVKAEEIVRLLEAEAKKRRAQAQGKARGEKAAPSVVEIIPQENSDATKTRDQLAKLFDTNPRYVQDAKRIPAGVPEKTASRMPCNARTARYPVLTMPNRVLPARGNLARFRRTWLAPGGTPHLNPARNPCILFACGRGNGTGTRSTGSEGRARHGHVVQAKT